MWLPEFIEILKVMQIQFVFQLIYDNFLLLHHVARWHVGLTCLKGEISQLVN